MKIDKNKRHVISHLTFIIYADKITSLPHIDASFQLGESLKTLRAWPKVSLYWLATCWLLYSCEHQSASCAATRP